MSKEPVASSTAERGRGRGRGADKGKGRGRGRGTGGEGRGGAPRPPQVEMVASGPFAMGPAMAGTSARRTAPRSNFAPIVQKGPDGTSKLGFGLTRSAAPSLGTKREEGQENEVVGKNNERRTESDDGEVYSDPDEGVEIIDMEHVRTMDWMAPESLRKDRSVGRKKRLKVKPNSDVKGKGTS